MAKNGSFDADSRARWLAELAVVLRDAERLTTALARGSEEVLELMLVRERILAAKNSLKSIVGRTTGAISTDVEPLWTMSPEPGAPRHDPLP